MGSLSVILISECLLRKDCLNVDRRMSREQFRSVSLTTIPHTHTTTTVVVMYKKIEGCSKQQTGFLHAEDDG